MEAPQAEMSVAGRILRVFYAPSETFEAVAEQRSAADWLVPTALVAAVVTVAALLVLAHRHRGRPRGHAAPGQGCSPDGDPDRHADYDVHLSPHHRCAFPSAGQIARRPALLRPSPSHNGLRRAGHSSPTRDRYAAHFGQKKTPEVQMGLGLFLSEEALQSFGGRFLASIDPFLVWWTVLVGLGLSIVGKLDRNRAYIGAIVLSLIWIAGFAGFASLGAAFTPNPNG